MFNLKEFRKRIQQYGTSHTDEEELGYTDYKPGMQRPDVYQPKNFVDPAQQKPVHQVIDFTKYEREEFIEKQVLSAKMKELPTCTDEWYAGTDADFIGPVNVTWDGRVWGKLEVEEKTCPNLAYTNCDLFDKYSVPLPEEAPVEIEVGPSDAVRVGYIYVRNNVENDWDYAENVNRDSKFSSMKKSPLNISISSALAVIPQQMENVQTEERRMPKSKITKVGSIACRNNVENECDYAENVNRDIWNEGGRESDDVDEDSDYSTMVFDAEEMSSRLTGPISVRLLKDFKNHANFSGRNAKRSNINSQPKIKEVQCSS